MNVFCPSFKPLRLHNNARQERPGTSTITQRRFCQARLPDRARSPIGGEQCNKLAHDGGLGISLSSGERIVAFCAGIGLGRLAQRFLSSTSAGHRPTTEVPFAALFLKQFLRMSLAKNLRYAALPSAWSHVGFRLKQQPFPVQT